MAKFKTIQALVEHVNAGKKVRILGANLGYTKGTVLAASSAQVSGSVAYVVMPNGAGYNWGLASVESTEETKVELEAEIETILRSKELVESKIAYLKATKQDAFDETEFKVWNTLQVMKGKKSELEKAKIIAKLINS